LAVSYANAEKYALLIGINRIEMLRAILRDDLLGSVGGSADHASTRVGGP
jgi:hypothetical protein